MTIVELYEIGITAGRTETQTKSIEAIKRREYRAHQVNVMRLEPLLFFKKSLATGTFVNGLEVQSIDSIKQSVVLKALIDKAGIDPKTAMSILQVILTDAIICNSVSATDSSSCDSCACSKSVCCDVFHRMLQTWKTSADLEHVSPSEFTKVFVGMLPTVFKRHMVFLRGTLTTPDMRKWKFNWICVVGPSKKRFDYAELGQCIATLMSNRQFLHAISRANNVESLQKNTNDFFNLLALLPLRGPTSYDNREIKGALNFVSTEKPIANDVKINVKPRRTTNVGRGSYDPLRRTGRLFRGFINDIAHRHKDYLTDFIDGFRIKAIVAIILTSFSAFTTAIALGEVLRSKTDGWLGLSEVMVAQCICGVLWGFFACQPLAIQSTTAAFVIFEGSLYKFCQAHNVEFMVVRVWTGVWVLIIMLVMIMLEAPFLIRFVTRFTEEVFDALISVMFIYDSLSFIIETFNEHPLDSLEGYCNAYNTGDTALSHSRFPSDRSMLYHANQLLTGNDSFAAISDIMTSEPEYEAQSGSEAYVQNEESEHEIHAKHPNTALLTLVLIMTTFLFATYLDKLKNSFYLGRKARKTIGNFSVPITLLILALCSYFLFPNTHLKLLDLPISFSPTQPKLRAWFINPFGLTTSLPIWVCFASVIPAVLLSILLFVELELVEFSLAQPERGLKKTSGFHADLVVSGVSILICALMGLPWMCAEPMQTHSHVSALSVRERATSKVRYVIEQRLTTICIALLLGSSAFTGRLLDSIPVAILMGIFVYLSAISLSENEFVHRIVLFFVPKKYFPPVGYCQNVSMGRMHLFTVIQIFCFVVIFATEITPVISVAFPFVVTIMVVVRHIGLPSLFSASDLRELDATMEEEHALLSI